MHHASLSAAFEREKNLKAALYTLVISGILVIVFFFLQWSLPQIPAPVADEGIEVNLGNSETGLGDVPPQLPGTPTDAKETNVSPPASAPPVKQQQNIDADDNNDPDAPAVNKPVKNIVKNTPVTDKPVPPKKNVTPTVATPSPKPPVPKALYTGGATHGNGGNQADSYNGVRNQGIAGGKGDQGNPNGNPNSDSYKGNSASGHGSGVTIRSGLQGRAFTHYPSFEDDFNQPAKVAVDIVVNRDGVVTSAQVNPRGTTTTDPNIREIAVRKAKQLKLNAGSVDEQGGTVVFDFKLHG